METEHIKACTICFEDFTGKETATPDVCEHVFCLQCLQKWARHGSFCPIDRKRFRKIINLSTSTQIPIKPKKRKKQQVLYDVSSYCEVCQKVKEDDTLILCDCCDLGYHLVCLSPPLVEVPPGIWHCPDCVAISEKLKLKKVLTKNVKNPKTLGLPTSSESSSSETNQANDQSSASEVGKNYSKPKTWFKSKDMQSSRVASPPFKRKYVRRTRSLPRSETDEKMSSEGTCKLKSLRPRHNVEKRYLDDLTESSDESQSVASNDSDTSSAIRSQDHIAKSTRSLRPRNLLKKRILYKTTSYDSSDTSNGYFAVSDSKLIWQEKSSEKSANKAEQSDYSTVALPEHDGLCAETLTTEKNNQDGFLSETYPSTSTADKAIPEASSVASSSTQNYETDDLTNSNICVIASTCSVKEHDNEAFDILDKTVVATHTITSLKSENECPIQDPSLPEIQTVEDEDDEISVIATVVKNPSSYEPLGEEEFVAVPDLSAKVSSDDDLPDLNLILSDELDDKLNVQNATSLKMFPHKESEPVFSVFEKLEDEDIAQKKYSELNKAVKTSYSGKKDSAVLVKKILPDSFKLCSKNISEINQRSSSETNALSKELRAIEKEKWKFHDLRSESSRRPSHKFRCCKSYGKNHYKSSDVVHIGKYFCQKKYSDNFRELASISRSLCKKPKWGEKDIVILNNMKRNKKICSKEGPTAVNSCDIQHPNIPTSSQASKLEKFPCHEIISVDKEGLTSLKRDQSALLRSALCLSNLKHLSVQNDGLLCLNWQK